MHVVVVESPTKAKTVQHYLGGDCRVLATWGHVRDLPAKDGSVRPDSGFAMTYASGPRARRVLGRIRTALKNADSLVLATDPDREGEAIAWQVLTWLQERGVSGREQPRNGGHKLVSPPRPARESPSPRAPANAEARVRPAPIAHTGTSPPRRSRSPDPDHGCMPNRLPDPGCGPPRAEGRPGSVA